MPIYEYRCSSCGHELEALQKLSEARLTTCPSCGAETLVKKLSAAGFQLKGSGWYATDFKSSGSKPPTNKESEGSGEAAGKAAGADEGGVKSEAKSEAKGESASDAKTEAKPVTKTETKNEGKGVSSAPAKGSGTPPTSS